MDQGQGKCIHVCYNYYQTHRNMQRRRFIMVPVGSSLTNTRVIIITKVTISMFMYESLDTIFNMTQTHIELQITKVLPL